MEHGKSFRGEAWEDDNYNLFSKDKYTEKEAEIASSKLFNCVCCLDCEKCIECRGCIDCKNCINCEECTDCRGCCNFINCTNCIATPEKKEVKLLEKLLHKSN